MIGVLIFLFILLLPSLFIVGLLMAIISKEKRNLGLILVLVAIVIELIGFAICNRILVHGPVHRDAEEEENYVNSGYFILEYAPTLDSAFCDPNQIVPTDFLTGHIYFGASGKLLHYANELGEWDSLRIETGEYTKQEDSIVCYFDRSWVIPYSSLDIHSIEKLDFKNAISKNIQFKEWFILSKSKNCELYPFYSKKPEKDFVGLVYKNISADEKISKEIVNLLNTWDAYDQSKNNKDTLNTKANN